jgi:hypothetical protein
MPAIAYHQYEIYLTQYLYLIQYHIQSIGLIQSMYQGLYRFQDHIQ